MARIAHWNPEDFAPGILKNCGDRLEKAGEVLRDAARAKMNGFAYKWKEHGPYQSGKNAGVKWTARHYVELKRTVRVVKKREEFDGTGIQMAENISVWIMAGNWLTWYAIQVEYGKGGWKGGAHPFMRPALRESLPKMKSVIEGGA